MKIRFLQLNRRIVTPGPAGHKVAILQPSLPGKQLVKVGQ